MNTIDYLAGDLAGLYWPAVVTALAVALMGGVLSVLIVLRRLAFIGQGVSHAAFGGVGLALALGMAAGGIGTLGVVMVVAVGSAFAIGWLSSRGRADTAIGVVLAGAMAAGFLLHAIAVERAPAGRAIPGLESVLFGDVLSVGWADAGLAWGVASAVLGLLWWHRRAVVFWAFDEGGAVAAGVRAGRVSALVLVATSLAVVASVKLAGVVLTTAVFVLPGATALLVSNRIVRVVAWSIGAAIMGTAGGLVTSFELDWLTGPVIVVAMLVLYGVALVLNAVRR